MSADGNRPAGTRLAGANPAGIAAGAALPPGGDARPRGAAGRGARLGRLASWDLGVVVLAVLTIVVASGTVENFSTSRNFTFLVLDLLPIALIALPMTFVIVTGEIDLSVASTLGLSSATMGYLWNQGLTIETIIPLCVVLGAVLGAVNGLFVTVFRLPSLAVTIGTMALFRGLALVVLGDTAVADFPARYTDWVTGTIGGSAVPNVLIPLAVLAALFGVVLHATPVGRWSFAAGASEHAARFAGIRVGRLKFWLYVVTGAVAGLAGVLWTLRYSSARADNGAGLELAVVAAVLLGGVSIFGGRGTLPGVVGGVVLLAALQNALRLSDVSNESLNVVTGALLVVSVLVPNLIRRTRSAFARTRHRPAPLSPPPLPGS
ncbi:ABC transporter permease [Frankia sp. CNm7]|uniref:Autoinducer 2 import system permease protein LsrD n=1 Tax=Frankia nepalensis TaxID=1836974 RepID=A0A937USH7_9ACTN|nr:ABC transporter permease [Frankia nepalensis]MBL7501874.1 ABC transporter permease [Frankia nepalensis]MBL7511875.1 ABC transporter permease [Frankia nepalensis]MBL7519143.1 ABC transporter permease [Frankia nepalensis]MBL7632492.1 ABC transporter permease [Frankia nepalensis]